MAILAKSNNSPADCARELFKPYKDLETLVLCNISFGCCVFCCLHQCFLTFFGFVHPCQLLHSHSPQFECMLDVTIFIVIKCSLLDYSMCNTLFKVGFMPCRKLTYDRQISFDHRVSFVKRIL